MLTKNKSEDNRIFYFDLLRVIACLFVVIIHSSAKYVVKDIGSFNFWVGNFFDSIVRSGVPIFVMISGALMLDEHYKFTKAKLIKHINKMIVFFFFWSVVYYLYFNIFKYVILNKGSICVINDIIYLVKGHFHLWFAYLIIGLYLIVPLLRLWVKDENKKYVEYFIALSIIFTYLIPQIISIGSYYSNIFEELNYIIEKHLQLKYIGGYTSYFILGWYLHNYDLKNKKLVVILGGLGLIITLFGTYILSSSLGKPIQMYDNLSINVLLQSVAIFIFIKSKFTDKNTTKNKLISSIAKYSLGIYGIHVMIITVIYEFLDKMSFDIAIVNIPAVFIISFIISYLITFMFSYIPILKKIV